MVHTNIVQCIEALGKESVVVRRRYKQFKMLHTKLESHGASLGFVPREPIFNMATELIDERKSLLQRMLNIITGEKRLRMHPVFLEFLHPAKEFPY